MKKPVFLILLALMLYSGRSQAQQAAGSYLISGAMDLARTDAPGVIRRFQIGTEVNYFYTHSLSFSGGYELNYSRPNHVTLGARFYPLEPLFIRGRALLGNESDVSLGAGYTHNITYRIRLEGMVDYYAFTQVVGFRVGFGVLIN